MIDENRCRSASNDLFVRAFLWLLFRVLKFVFLLATQYPLYSNNNEKLYKEKW